MSSVQLSKKSGVSEPTISKYRSGDQVWVSADDLTALATGISDDPRDRAGLIKAHLLDECNGPGAELIEIGIRGQHEISEASPAQKIRLPKEAEENFTAIREWYIKDSNVREIVDGLGNLLRTGDCRIE